MMDKINAVITGVDGYVPDDVLTNADLSKMVDTTDEWIMTRVGIKERRILKDPQLGTAYMGVQAVGRLVRKKGIDPETIDGIICSTSTADYHFPSTASMIAYEAGCKNAFAFDIQAACAGFIYALETASNFIRSGRYKRMLVVSSEKMSAITDYQDRSTCPLFGDGCGVALLEPTCEDYGVMDTILRAEGTGKSHLIMKAGGAVRMPSYETIDKREHFVYQEGQAVFKRAVIDMADAAEEIVRRNGLTKDEIDWIVPHQANLRIIDAAARRLGVDDSKVMVNIRKYGNTSSATIPLCLWEWEKKLKKGDNIVMAAFGAGWTWGANYVKWAYDGSEA